MLKSGLISAVSLVLLATLTWVGYSYEYTGNPTVVVVDARQRFQTIDGWGVYPKYWQDDKVNDRFDRSFEPIVGNATDALVNEVGINRVRVEIWSGLENPTDYWKSYFDGEIGYREFAPVRYEKINDNDDPRSADLSGFQFSRFDYQIETAVLPILKAIEENGEVPFVNLCYVDFRWKASHPTGSLSHARSPQEFAEFVLVFFERLRDKYGIVPDSFEIILEPENTEGWTGRAIGEAIIEVRKRLAESGFDPRLVAPSNTSTKNALRTFEGMQRVDGALDALDTFSYHRYRDSLESEVKQIGLKAKEHGLKTAMLEWIGGDIDTLMDDLLVADASAWTQWAAATVSAKSDDRGAYYLQVDTSKTPPGTTLSERSLQLSQVFRFVRRGAVRVGASSNQGHMRVAAFLNTDGGLVLVIRALGRGGRVNVTGLPNGRYASRFVGDDRSIEQIPTLIVDGSSEVDVLVDQAGVLTLYPEDMLH